MVRSKRRILVVGIAAVAAIFLGALVWVVVSAPREPVYKGETLTVWVERYVDGLRAYNRRSNPDFLEAEAAIRAIGTDGIPILLSRLREPENGWKQKLRNLLKKQSAIKPPSRDPLVLRREAGKAFGALGASASNAVPDLMQIYRESNSDEIKLCCLEAIISIGPGATAAAPILLKEAADPAAQSFIRFLSVNGLRDIATPAEMVVPAMIALLKDRDGGVRYNAIQVLGAFGSDAKAAVPALLQFHETNTFSRPDLNLKYVSETALKKIDPEAAAKAGIR